jgi:PAS domain S-box-containing protein
LGHHSSTIRELSRSEAADMIRSACQAATSSKGAVLVSGPAGIGKTTLVNSALLDLPIALLGFGKGEQFGSAQPYRPVVEALNDALQRWLPGARPSELQFLRHSIEGYEDLLATLLPALSTAWEPPDTVHPLSLEQRNRTPFALRALVHAMSRLSKPLVIVLDDFQWLDEETLKRMEWGFADPELKAVLCVFCCRDESPALQRADGFLKTLSNQAGEVQQIRIGPLTQAEIAQTVSERLKRPVSELSEQIELLSQTSAGSPLYLQRALDLIASGGTLAASPPGETGDVLDILTRQLESYTAAEREILGLVACSGRQVGLPTLAYAGGLVAPNVDVETLVSKAIDSGFLTVINGQPVKQVRVTHDRVQEACAGGPTSWPARHLALFEAGAHTLPKFSELDDQQLFWMLDRELTAAPLLVEHPQRVPALQLAILASQRARFRAASQTSLRAAALARRLLSDSDPRETRVAVLIENAIVSWITGDSYRFVALSKEIYDLATPLEFVRITELKLRDAIARGEMVKTVELSIEAAQQLLPSLAGRADLNYNGFWNQPIDVRNMLERIDALGSNSDPTTVAVTSLLTTAYAAAYVGDPERLKGLIAMQLNLALEAGTTPSFPLTLAYWGATLTTQGATLGLAIEIGERALSRSQLGNDGIIQARTTDLVYGMVLCWKGDLRHVIHPLLQNRDLALRHGTFEYAGYSLLKSLTYRLYTGSPLSGLARDITAGRAEMLSLRQTRMARYLERDEAVLRQLQAPGPNPSGLSDSLFDGPALEAELSQSGDRYGLLYTAIARLLLAILYEQNEESAKLAAQAESYRDGGPGLAHQAMLSWLAALAVLSGKAAKTPEQMDLARASLRHLEIVCVHAPYPWSSRAAFLKAEILRHQGSPSEIETAFEEALQLAIRSSLMLDEILICQRRALLDAPNSLDWKKRGQTALGLWRSRPQNLGAEVRPDLLLDAAAKLANSPNLEMLGASLVELLLNTVGGEVGVIVGPGSALEPGNYPGLQLIGHWNAPPGYGTELLQSVIKSGQPYLDGNCVCVPILRGGTANGAILINSSQSNSEHPRYLDNVPCIRSLAQLAGVAMTNIGQKRELDRVENEFSDREALYTTLIHESTAAFFVHDTEGRLLLGNQAYARALGETPLHSLLGRVVFNALPASQAKVHQLLDQSVLETGQELEALEQLGPNLNQLRTYLCLRIPTRDRWGTVTGVCGIGTDITELERTREQLDRERHLSALGTFAGKIAHDFNNVLNGIVCNVELLLSELDPETSAYEGLTDIESAAEQGVRLVKQILAFGGQQEPQRNTVSLTEVVESCLGLLKATLPSGTHLTKSLKGAGLVMGDSTQLAQVVTNLVVNAAHSLPKGNGSIQITIDHHHQDSTRPLSNIPPGNYVRLTVTDTGCGMTEETMNKAFEPFYSTKPSGQGTGLGLAIVHGIVKSHGGHISLESQLGQGTSFSLCFPALGPPGS